MRMVRAMVRVVAWLLFLTAAIAVLTLAGRGPLAVPALTDVAAWRAWFGDRDAIVMVFALARMATLAVGWYLAGATVVELLARGARWQPLTMVADIVTVPAARRLLQSVLGLGLATASLTVAIPAPRPADVSGIATAVVPQPAPPDIDVTQPSTAKLELETPAPRALPVAEATSRPHVWTVARGEHFWTIAEQLLARAWRRSPSDEEITRYWSALVAANRDRLADPANPDLIYPGQRLRVPQPPQRP